ncbi:rho GTPase-activating protein 8 [Sorex araneus]|uniref:rho GTPase-activating protein 8 n=1 Tax=Sorex araneus TaxID=42254 RepID=UPI00243360D2|nr:rho GTPase-activating protein 8 [Sorex araneus]
MSQLDLEELAEIEREEEAALLGTAQRPSETLRDPTVAEEQLALSNNHLFYDVARHGFLQVAGQDHFGRHVVTFSCCRLPPSHQLTTGACWSKSCPRAARAPYCLPALLWADAPLHVLTVQDIHSISWGRTRKGRPVNAGVASSLRVTRCRQILQSLPSTTA